MMKVHRRHVDVLVSVIWLLSRLFVPQSRSVLSAGELITQQGETQASTQEHEVCLRLHPVYCVW